MSSAAGTAAPSTVATRSALDAIAELELLDVEIRARYEALGGGRED